MSKNENPKHGLFGQVPELEKFWDRNLNRNLDPSSLSKGSEKSAWWICGNNHSFEKKIFDMVRSGCSFCSNRSLLSGFNDLATVRPELAREFDLEKNGGLSASSVLAGSAKKVWWKCSEGHSFSARISDRKFSGSACPYCRGLYAIPGKTDILTRYPEITAAWDYVLNGELKPENCLPFSEKKVYWKCPAGHSWLMRVKDRVINSQGCSVCGNHQIVKGINDLATLHPEIASTLALDLNAPDFAQTVGPHSQKIAWWNCERNHTYQAPVKRRHNSGCPVCAGQKVMYGVNDLETQNPDAASHFLQGLNGVSPREVLVSSRVKYYWECDLGHKFRAHPDSIFTKKTWCPYCANKKVLAGFNDLETKAPDVAREWHPEMNGSLKASDVIYGSHAKYWWVCSNGHTFHQSVKKRREGQGCPSCAKTGFNPSKPAMVYVLVHKQFNAIKVGITNTDSPHRLKLLYQTGWRRACSYVFPEGIQAESVEKKFFRHVRQVLGVPAFLDASKMRRTGGWTETMDLDLMPETKVVSELERAIAELGHPARRDSSD
jgi:hypothetical protein